MVIVKIVLLVAFDTDYTGKAKLAQKLIDDYDLVIVHIKGTDLCGHDNLPFKKAEIVEKIDFDVCLLVK